MKCIFGIDVGGTNIKIGKYVQGGFIEKYHIKTIVNDDYHTIINQIVKEINSNIKNDTLVGIGIGIPGPVYHGVVLKAQNIKWEIVNLVEEMKVFFPDVPIEVLNDANAATLGEWYYGTEDDTPNFVFMTLGTGIGGGIVINNHLVEGAKGSAGEIGHIKIFPFNGRPCTCGLSGCIEQYASATGIVKTAKGMINNGKTILTEKPRLNSKDVFDAAYAGDKIALEIVDKTCYYLAIALANIANTLNPDRIVLGGGVSKAGELLLNGVRKYFDENAFYSIKGTQILLATLYNDAGIYGCVYKVLETLNLKDLNE